MSAANMPVTLPEWFQDLSAQGIVITDADLRVSSWNRWMELYSGRSAADAIGRHLFDLYPELATRHFDKYYHQALAGQVIVLAQRLHHYLLPMPATNGDGAFEYMQQSARIGPLLAHGQVVGTTTTLEDVSERVARENELRRLLSQEQAARGRLTFMAEASALLAASLDYETTLQQVSALMLPALADYCLIDLVAEGRQLQRVVMAHTDPAKQALLYELERRYPHGNSGGQPGLIAIQTGKPAIILNVPDSVSLDRAQDAEHHQMIERLATRSVLAAPLIAREQILGAITLCASQPDRYGNDELALVEELARRAALAIDNARLYQQAQTALRARDHALAIVESERAKLHRLFTEAPAAICILEGPQHRFAFVNALYSQIFGDRDLIGMPLSSALPEIASQGFVDLLDQVYATGESFIGNEMPAQIPQGSDGALETHFYNFVYQATRDANKIVDGVLVHAIDVTQQVLAQRERAELLARAEAARAEAETAVQVRDQFFSVAAHELKTPLTSLRGNVQLIQRRTQRDGLLQARDQRALEVVAAQTERLQQMIEALLDVTRLESGHLSLHRERFDFGNLVQRVVEEVQPALTLHTLEYQAPQASLFVEGDALRLEQVLQNLIQNAIKYSPAGGAITLQTAAHNQQVCVSVTDQGIGIPQGALQHLFGRFYRARNVDAQHISGMGIGLYVVKEIITLHNGTVTVDSIEGQGSTFTFCLPLYAD